MSPPSLRIVILNYNTRDLLADCLGSLQADPDHARWHVVVVDNASSDDSADAVRRDFPWATLIESPDNRGFSAGNNLGTQGADEPYLLFLNSDTVAPPGAIGRLEQFIRSHADCVVVAPRLLSPDGSLQHSCRGVPGPLNTLLEGFGLDRLFPRSRFFGRPRLTWIDHETTSAVPYVAGAAMMVAREDFEAVGGWPEEYFFYAEDADLCRALTRDGRQVCYVGEVTITHIGGASASQQSLWTTRQAARSVLLFSLRNGGPGRLLAHRIALLLTTLPRLIGALLLWPVAALRKRGQQIALRLQGYLCTLRAALSPVGR